MPGTNSSVLLAGAVSKSGLIWLGSMRVSGGSGRQLNGHYFKAPYFSMYLRHWFSLCPWNGKVDGEGVLLNIGPVGGALLGVVLYQLNKHFNINSQFGRAQIRELVDLDILMKVWRRFT